MGEYHQQLRLPANLLKYRMALLFILLLVLVYFPVFLHLSYMPFRSWDESILGVNAIEMLHNHNYIVTWFYGQPDMSNCKPPLMIWCIVLCSKILGFSELSVRLPSALAALALCIYLFFMLRKCMGSYLYAFITVIVLLTCQGYVRNHVIRTGEYDSLLVLFSTVFSLSLYAAINAVDRREQSRYLFLFFVFLTLAVLTKGIAPMMQAPALFLYAAARKKIIPFLKTKALYAGLAFFIFFGIGFYFLRESVNPGYLKAVWGNELGGRFSGTVEGHAGPIIFYLNEIVTWQFTNYLLLFPVALFAGFIIPLQPLRRLVVFSVWCGFSFLFFISIASTKLPHYDAPLFPYLAIIIASLFYTFYTFFRTQLMARYDFNLASLISFLLISGFLIQPYSEIISKVYFPHGDSWEEGFSVSCKYFQQLANGNPDCKSDCKIVMNIDNGYGLGTILTCYKEEFDEKGLINLIIKSNQLSTGDKAVVFDPNTRQSIDAQYETETTKHLGFCYADIISVKAKKHL